MTLLYIDGFDVQDMALRWDNMPSAFSYTTSNTQGNQGSAVQVGISAGAFNVAKKSFAAQTTLHVGFAFYADASATSSFTQPCLIVFGDSGATQHLWIGYNGSDRKWVARLNNWAGTILATSTATYAGGSWVYVEAMVVVNATTGRVKLNIDGATVIDFTGNTKNGGTNDSADAIGIGTQADFGTSGAKMYYDDLYLLNGSGSANNTFLGRRTVIACKPTGAGSSTQWASATGPNWDNVNDVPPVDATYNYDGTSGHRDTYALNDLPTGGTVDGIQVVTRMSMSGSGAVSAKAAVKSGAVVAYGATRVLGATATQYHDVWETDPNTGAAWTADGVNALEAGAEVA